MPSPRLLGSGVLKILPLPHRLQDELFNLVAFPSYLSEPCICPVFCRFLDSSVLWGFSCARRSGAGSLAIPANVAILLAVIALYLSQVSSLSFFSEVTVMRGKQRSCVWFILLFPFCSHPSDIVVFRSALLHSSAIS